MNNDYMKGKLEGYQLGRADIERTVANYSPYETQAGQQARLDAAKAKLLDEMERLQAELAKLKEMSAPASWTNEMKEYWPELPEKLRQMILASEKKRAIGMHKKASKIKGDNQ